MTDQASHDGNAPQEQSAGTSTAENGFTPIASQADLDKIISERLSRERAKYADYADLKTKASEFDKIAEASKTELEKMQDALAASRAEAETLRLGNVKAELKATLATVTPDATAIVDDLDLKRFITDDGQLVPDAVTALVDRFKSLTGPRRPQPDPSQGAGATAGANGAPSSPAEQFASFLKSQLATGV